MIETGTKRDDRAATPQLHRSGEGITQSQMMDKLTGGNRSDDQIMRDGARATLSQIDKLRNQLNQLERDAQHVMATGKERKDSAAIWKRVAKAAGKLLDGVA